MLGSPGRHRVVTALLALVCSAAASPASADVTLGWFNLQWPPTININLGSPTDTIYGQVWAQGVTDAAGQGAGILAQVGYGPDGTQPTDPGWNWFAMSYNVDAGNNDEYSATFVPTQAGTFDYATRYSGDGGATWGLADLSGPQLDNTLDNPGSLVVVPEPGATVLVAAALGLLSRRRRRDPR
jgi:hypothetical protein